MLDLFIFYYFLPMLLSFLWFRNLVWLLENLKHNKDIKWPKIFGSILSSALVGAILFSIFELFY